MSEFRGVQRVDLVGRSDILNLVRSAYEEGTQPNLFYLRGQGGLGKTAVLETVLGQAVTWNNAYSQCSIVASDLIDFYHVENQSVEGLITAIMRSLGCQYFPGCQSALDSWREIHALGIPEEVTAETWKKVESSFFSDFKKLMEDRTLLLAFDTAEVLEYVVDPFRRDTEMTLHPEVLVVKWLVERFLPFLAELRARIVFLIAGRCVEHSVLEKGIEELDGWRVIIPEPLQSLSADESVLYLDKVAQQIESRDPEGATRIREYIAVNGERTFQLTRGRPIYLSLVADILAAHSDLLSIFWGDESAEVTDDDVEKILTYRLQEVRSPLGMVIRALSWLPKGGNAELVARLMPSLFEESDDVVIQHEHGWHLFKRNLRETDVQQVQEWLHEAEQLTIVKHRPQGERSYFLHDEVLHLIRKYREQIDQVKWETLSEIVEEYYVPLRNSVQSAAEQRSLLAEELFYRVDRNPWRGFEFYFWASEGALEARDNVLDLLLTSEFFRAISAHTEYEGIDHSFKRRVNMDAAIRWGERVYFLYGDPNMAGLILQNVEMWRKKKGLLWEDLGTAKQHYDLYSSFFSMRQGKIREGYKGLSEMPPVKSLDESLIANVLQAEIWGYLGYAEDLQGRQYRAVDWYYKSANLQRQIELKGLVGTLVSQVYAMGIIGWFRRGRHLAKEAASLARRWDSAYLEASVLNVWALLEGWSGDAQRGVRLAEQALVLLREGRYRLTGLIQANRAWAYRYVWNQVVEESDSPAVWKSRGLSSLTEGWVALNKEKTGALTLLKPDEGGKPSKDYLEALMTKGYYLRWLAWLERNDKFPELADDWREKVRQRKLSLPATLSEAQAASEQCWMEVAGITSREGDWVAQVKTWTESLNVDLSLTALALVNLGWHYYFMDESDENTLKPIHALFELVPQKYMLDDSLNLSVTKEDSNVRLWPSLGKGVALFGRVTFRSILQQGFSEHKVREMSRYAIQNFEYNLQVGEGSFDLRRAEDGLHLQIIQIPEWETRVLPILYDEAHKAAAKAGRKITLLQFLEQQYGTGDE